MEISSVPPRLVRQNTMGFAKMKPHATYFNDAINIKKNEWDYFVTNLNLELIKAANDTTNKFHDILIRCVGNRFIINQAGEKTTETIPDFPKIFMLGGAAYSAYGKFFANMGHHTMETVAPRTHDWDIVVCVNDLSEETVRLFGLGLVTFIEQNISLIEQSNYLDMFENLDSRVGEIIDKEQIAYVHPSNKIEVSVLNKKTYVNLRLNMALNINGRKMKTHIVEFVLWGPSSHFYDGIDEINILSTSDGMTSTVPIISDLVLLTTRGVINRGTSAGIMAKCRQDFARLKYLCDTLNLSDELSVLLKKGNACDIASEVLAYLKQCSAELSDDEFNIIEEEARGTDRSSIVTEMESKISPLLNRREKILFLPKVASSYESKYLKYKQKYLALKEKLKQK